MTFLAKLKRFYGDVPSPEPHDPFAIIVWENAAYLVDDARRSLVFENLKNNIGIDPAALLAAGSHKIEAAIRGGGMQPPHRAEKVLRCAQIAVEYADGDLLATLRALDGKGRRTLLKRFPGIADPGVAKVLLFCGLVHEPAIDSNGLRVLTRLGAITENRSYAINFREGVTYLLNEGIEREHQALDAFALLRHHGRELCKRTHPHCERCPLRKECKYANVPAQQG